MIHFHLLIICCHGYMHAVSPSSRISLAWWTAETKTELLLCIPWKIYKHLHNLSQSTSSLISSLTAGVYRWPLFTHVLWNLSNFRNLYYNLGVAFEGVKERAWSQGTSWPLQPTQLTKHAKKEVCVCVHRWITWASYIQSMHAGAAHLSLCWKIPCASFIYLAIILAWLARYLYIFCLRISMLRLVSFPGKSKEYSMYTLFVWLAFQKVGKP